MGKKSNAEPVRCQKCGKPIGYVTVLSSGLTSFQQPIKNVKIMSICMECAQKKK
jgi:DNA-directed RNA polymerase subunit N (RpoN/RPB10)